MAKRTRRPRPESIDEMAMRRFSLLMRHVTLLLTEYRHPRRFTDIEIIYRQHPVSRPLVTRFLQTATNVREEIAAAYRQSQTARTRPRKEAR